MRLALRLFLLLGAFLASPALASAPETSTSPVNQIMVMLPLPVPHFRVGATYSSGYGDDAGRGARHRAAARIARMHMLTLVNSWPMPTLGVECFVMEVPTGRAPDDVAKRVSADPAVQWSEAVATYAVEGEATGEKDALYPMQPAATAWPLATLHRSLTGRNVTVAVIDSGVDLLHPDLAGQIVLSRNFAASAYVGEKHGTAVAGVIAARANNQVGIAGIAPDAKIMALRACTQASSGTLCDSFSLAKAIQFALERKAPILNMSLSGPPSRLLAELLREGLEHGSTVVAAVDVDQNGGGFPASLSGVIAVRGENMGRSSILAYNAPAQDIPTPQPGKKWALVSGTSYAAAHVSGLLALLRQERGPERQLKLAPATGGPIDICATFGNRVCAVSASRR
ncbi:MAG: S8 family serine peptidase [Sphingobium sp.]|nr:S8 family serine peptidase [Sphingobium sp.]